MEVPETVEDTIVELEVGMVGKGMGEKIVVPEEDTESTRPGSALRWQFHEPVDTKFGTNTVEGRHSLKESRHTDPTTTVSSTFTLVVQCGVRKYKMIDHRRI